MKTFTVAAVLLAAAAAHAQEDLDSDLEKLAEKISPEGAGAKMAALLKTDAGRLLVKERMALLVAKAIERIDKDPQGHWERHLFARDADGNLNVRPERKREFEALAREVERRVKAWPEFDKAAAEIAAKIPDQDPLGKKLKSYWKKPEFRLALYQRVPPESRDADPEELWDFLIGRSLFRGNDGKLRLRGSYRNESVAAMAEVRSESDSLAGAQEQVAKVLEKLVPADRKACATAEGRVVVGQRLVKYAGEGAEDPVAKLVEADLEPAGASGLRFKGDSRAVLEDIASLTALGAEIKPLIAEVAPQLADDAEYDRNLKKLLMDERAAVLLVARMRQAREERRANLASAVQQFRDDHFDADESGAIALKKGRFVDDQGKESVEALAAECEGILSEFAETRTALQEVAERALEAAVAALFQARQGASALKEHQTRVIEDLKQAERESGLRKFMGASLERAGDRYVLRAAYAARVEEMARRVLEVEKALDRASREEAQK